ncbi:MAG: glycosyltransferase family 4 protein [Magnetococcales bacterium]|nr:glycosyltransferase family 4 protein [Magnetococcales bacterium]
MAHPTLLFLITEDYYFCSHRLPIARAAREAGFRVVVAAREQRHGETIRQEGFDFHPLRALQRGFASPGGEAAALRELIGLYRRVRPDLVHHVAMKPVLYGSLAASLTGVPRVVNALAGMGYLFTASTLKARLLRPPVRLAFRLLLGRPGRRVIVQNPDDLRLFVDNVGLPPERMALIRGSGVDAARFTPSPEPPTEATPDGPRITALFVGRMLWDKGVGEIVEAARRLRERRVPVRLRLAGTPDPINPQSIPEATLRQWHDEGLVEWIGHHDDVAPLWRQAHVALLPSYREGLPKSLLEAAACGRPLLSTDTTGCREIARHDKTGLLVPVGDGLALADALERLAKDGELRRRLGANARHAVERAFAQEIVVNQTLELYRELLG